MNDYKQILSYEGEITFEKIEDILTLFNQRMPDTDCPLCKIRLFSIMVECLENAHRHNFTPIEQNPQIKVVLLHNNGHFELTVGNRIANNDLQALTQRIDMLNRMSQEEIKSLYTKTIRQGHISEKGGAGLGLMKIMRSSREPMKYTIKTIDNDSSFIEITTSITDIKNTKTI